MEVDWRKRDGEEISANVDFRRNGEFGAWESSGQMGRTARGRGFGTWAILAVV